MPRANDLVKFEMEGLQDVLKALDGLSVAVQKRILKAGVNDGAKPIMDDIKRRAKMHQDTGTLWKSIGRRVVVMRKTGIVVVIIGPRTKFLRTFVRTPKGVQKVANAPPPTRLQKLLRRVLKRPRAAKGQIVRLPTKYFHLLEFGTYRSAAKPIARPAFDTQKELAMKRMKNTILNKIEDEAAKAKA